MGSLKDDLPAITKEVLHEEDNVTKGLVKTLIREVMMSQNKLDPYPSIKKILDDEIEKSISSGLVDFKSLEGEF